MSYVIAFSNEGATDVTRRYVRNPTIHGAERNQCPEEVLMYIINEIRQLRRKDLPKEEKRRLIREDQREERELRNYVVSALTAGLEKLVISTAKNSAAPTSASGDIKLPTQITGREAYMRARSTNGNIDEQQQQPPREGEGH